MESARRVRTEASAPLRSYPTRRRVLPAARSLLAVVIFLALYGVEARTQSPGAPVIAAARELAPTALRGPDRGLLAGLLALLAIQLALIAALARTSAIRRRTSEALSEKTEELDRYFTSSLDLLCIADTSGRFQRLNPEWEKVLGYSIAELEGRRFLDYVHPDDLPSTLDTISRLDAQEEIHNFTNRYRCKDGSYRWIEWRSKPLGSIIYAAARDITDRIDAEERLRRSDERFNLAMLAVNDGIWDWNIRDGSVYFDSRYYSLSGYKPDEFPHRFDEFQSRVHPDDVDRVLAEARAHLEGSIPIFDVEFRFRRKDGSWMWIRGRGKGVARDDMNRIIRMVGTHTDVTDRKLAEEQLRQANLVVENSPAVLFRWRPEDWRTLMVSANVVQFSCAPEDLLSGRIPFASLIHPEDLKRVEREVREHTEAGLDRFEQTYRLVAPDGSVHWVDDRTKVVRDHGGRVLEYQGILLDITDRKKMAADLERSLNFQRALLDAVPVAVFYKDREAKYQGCNKVFAEIMGVTSEGIRGKTVQELWPGDMAETYHSKDLEIMDAPGRQTYEYRIRDLNGVERPVIFSKDVFRDERGEVAGIVGAFLDITERRRAEQGLEALNATLEQRIGDRTRELAEMNTSLAASNADLKKTLEDLHETQDSLVRSEKHAALGQLVAGFAHELNTPLGAILSSNRSLALLIETRLRDASRSVARMDPKVIEWFDARLRTSLGSRTQLEEPSRLRPRRLALESRLAAFGRPVSKNLEETILDLRLDEDERLFRLAADHPDIEEAIESLAVMVSIKTMSSVIAAAADKCADVVSALLFYSRKDEPAVAPSKVAVAKELDGLLDRCAAKLRLGVRVTKEYQCPGFVPGDRVTLNQVWMNLLTNALQAMEYRGVLGLSLEESGPFVAVSVRDTGPGVPAELREKIFEPFFTTKKSGEGTGLGLDLCRRIVERHGGRIELESEPGNTVFRVLLPRWDAAEG